MEPKTNKHPQSHRGRGALTNASGRFEAFARVPTDDGWDSLDDLPPLKTEIVSEAARHIITRNTSPDVGFDRSINPYRGCEHGCVYCFARPTHAYMGLSPGLDFETRLFAKPNAAKLLRGELSKPGYKAKPIAIGTNTDPYQPLEKTQRIMRSLLEVLAEFRHPVLITTKSAMVARDLDILSDMAKDRLAHVTMSVTTLDRKLARVMEPRASTPARRLSAMAALHEAGIPVGVAASPMIPALNDQELEAILTAGHKAGATSANYIVLRVPLEVRDLFKQWLFEHYPDRYRHVLSLLRSMRGGADYDARWGVRMTGTGPYADVLAKRFKLAVKKLGLKTSRPSLRTSAFRGQADPHRQMDLFGG
ncbi:MAG: PA0069 family radical SAM protein [Devosiaceae bacterium]|nr:PA0069 family radical SAM protein [Devosiaceae bacterium MH13]